MRGERSSTGAFGIGRAVSLAIALTSAFWVALGAWLFNGHVSSAHHLANGGTVEAARSPGRGLLGGFGGSAPVSRPGAKPPVPASQPVNAGPLTIPVASVGAGQLVDTFSQARAEGARHHDAIDIPATEGTPVVAAAAGTVEKLFLSQDGGQTIYVRSPDRKLIYYYAHLAAYAPGLREGQAVRRGDRLGAVGHTGNAAPEVPHLHFAMWRADPAQGWYQEAPAINPYPLLRGSVRR